MGIRKSGISTDFTGMWLGTTKPKNAEQAEYIAKLSQLVNTGRPWCLVVGGTPGNGKSYLAQIAVNTFNDDRDRGGYYVSQAILQDELRGEREKEHTIRWYCSRPMLVIDEISDSDKDWTEYIKTNIESILIERHRQGLRTVIIGNVTLDRFVAMFSKRVRDRFREGMVQTMTGPSLRRTYGA